MRVSIVRDEVNELGELEFLIAFMAGNFPDDAERLETAEKASFGKSPESLGLQMVMSDA